ncbi:MAG: hypothetical protein O3A55_04830 [Bacteroidetes bacterium]|nr:hypothetical protein [Bacteroidota bacterium]
MIFILWSAITLHVISYIAWIGGILFLSGVFKPIANYFEKEIEKTAIPIYQRFIGFTWMLVWTILVTGVILFLLGMRQNWWQNISEWEIMIFAHSIFIFMMIFVSLRVSKVLKQTNNGVNSNEVIFKFNKFNSINVVLCFGDLITISGMILYKWVQ